jgi:signal transduction histidine kinase
MLVEVPMKSALAGDHPAQPGATVLAEAAGRRFAFLAEVGREISSSLEPREMLTRLADLVVAELADYCLIDVFDERGAPRRIAVAHRRPEGRELVLQLQRRHAPTLGARTGAALVMRTGEPLLAAETDEAQLRAVVQDEEHLRLLLRLGVRPWICVPLLTHGRVLGAVSLVIAEGDRRYGPDDLELAEEIGLRTALALDNAQLYQQTQAEVAERKRLEEELRRRVEELAAADRRKDEFLAMLAHELRNPLAAIANAGQVLDGREGIDPHSRELLAMIGRQSRHLARLVDDLLDVSRFSRGRIELRCAPIELRRAIEGAVESARPHVEQRRHALTISLPDEPLWLQADLTRIEQVFANLLHNAAKFTEPGGSIELAAERRATEVVVRVRDDGTGIAPELLPNIFDLFVQEERSLARSRGGLGIGLTLVRTLVERHGGSIEAASDGPGRGSELRVRLPLIPTPAAAAAPLCVPPPAVAGGIRVLLVEDNLDAAEALGELLRLWGHQVEMAHDGVAALHGAREGRPDVVLLDIGLPGMDGYEVAGRLRATPGLERVTLIALTGYGQEADRQRSRLAGFDHHLVKPVDLDGLRALLTAAAA